MLLLERHITHNVHTCMEQQHGTFEIRLYQNSRQLGISVYGGVSIYHIHLILDFFHIFWRLVQWQTRYMDASWRWVRQWNSQIIWEFSTLQNFQKSWQYPLLALNTRIIFRRLKLDNISQLMNMGSCMLKKTYIHEWTVEDHIALSVIQELRRCMSGIYFINGFTFHEIDAICTM